MAEKQKNRQREVQAEKAQSICFPIRQRECFNVTDLDQGDARESNRGVGVIVPFIYFHHRKARDKAMEVEGSKSQSPEAADTHTNTKTLHQSYKPTWMSLGRTFTFC